MNQSFDSTDGGYTIRHLTGLVRSVIVQRTFCPLRSIFVLSIIHPLLIQQSPLVHHSLSVTCPLHMRYSRVLSAPHTFRKDPHRHRDDFHHRMNTGLAFFAFSLSVRRLLPLSVLICYNSTIRFLQPFIAS